MKQKITDALLNTNIDNIGLNCTFKLSMVARLANEKMITCYDNGVHLIMRSYDLTDRDGNIYYIKCYFKDIIGTITDIDVKVIEENYETPKKIAREFIYCPALRVIVPTDCENEYETAQKIAEEKLRGWTKEEIIDWVLGNETDFTYHCEPYNEEYDED
jgi:hypothetical protein